VKADVESLAPGSTGQRDGRLAVVECPLVTAMRALDELRPQERAAHAAGDEAMVARLRAEREGWRHLYEFTCQRLCVALREEFIAPAASVMADAALACMPPTVPADQQAELRRRLAACVLYPSPDACPVLQPRPPA
jgi:hypothetical protein